MKEFLKQLASKLIFTAFKFYRNKTLYEIKKELVQRYADLAGQISLGSRAALFVLTLCSVVAGGFVLIPLAVAAIGAGVCAAVWPDKPALAVVCAGVVLALAAALYILVPVAMVLKHTSEETLRKKLEVERFERRMLGK